jgi:hypothetical protein
MHYSRNNEVPAIPQFAVVPVPHGGLAAGTIVYPKRTDFYHSYYEAIVTQNGLGSWHECEHYKKTLSLHRPTSIYSIGPFNGNPAKYYSYTYDLPCWQWDGIASGNPQSYGLAAFPLTGMTSLVSWIGDVPTVYRPSNVEQLCAQAMQALMPGIKPKLSLINSLIELKDLRTIGRTLLKGKQLLKAMLSSKKSVSTSAVAASADVYLQQEFNAKPLVRDVFNIYKALRNVREQLDELYRNELKYITAHWQIPLTEFVNVNESKTLIPSDYYGGHLLSRVVSIKEARFCVTVDYAYDLRGISRERALVDGLLDYLGVNINPAIIWNAIPWSFVIDWAFGVSQWLNQMKIRNIEPYTVIYRSMYSIKVNRKVDTFLRAHQNGPEKTTVPVSTLEEKAYCRSFFDPNVIRSLTQSDLSLNEFVLASALIASKAKPRR